MADFPTATDIFAFAVFFVPGYLSLNIGSYLMRSKPLDLPWDEKIVVSYAWSLLIFLPIFTILGLPLTASNITTSLTTPTASLILGSTVVFGFLSGLIYWVALRFLLVIIPTSVRKLGAKIGLESEEFSFDSTAVRFLKVMWEKRNKNELIVETNSGRMLRGQLASKSFEPTMDVSIQRPTPSLPILELVEDKEKAKDSSPSEPIEDKWKELDEWSILVPEGNIRTVRAIESRAKQENNDVTS